MKNPKQSRNLLYGIVLLAAAYFATGKLGLLLAVPPGYATAVWPPSGIALGGLLILGSRCWLGVWLGSFCVNASMGFDSSTSATAIKSLSIAAFIAVGATVQAWAGAEFIRKKIGWPSALLSASEVGWFMAIGGPLTCLINSTCAVTTLWLAG
jgi:integral membrane sensor domain MASE1